MNALSTDLRTYLENENALEKEIKQLNETEQKCDEKLASLSNAIQLLMKCIDQINCRLANKDDDKEYESATIALTNCIHQLSETMKRDNSN